MEEKSGIVLEDYTKLSFSRQEGFFNPREKVNTQVNVIGAGGIGSPTLICLSKMGCDKINVWDDDMVEHHNLSSQFYRFNDLGMSKVDSIGDIVKDFAGIEINRNKNRIGGEKDETFFEGLVISGVDTMEARRAIWEKVRFNMNVPLYIDARMGAEVIRIFTVNPVDMDEIERYEASIDPSIPVVELRCTEKAIIYNTFAIAALVSNQVKKFFNKEKLSYQINFDLKNMTFICL